MTAPNTRHRIETCAPLTPSVPSWAMTLISTEPSLCLVHEQFHGSLEMDMATFQSHVAAAYRSIFLQLASQAARHPVRFWAYVPGIHDELAPGINRYMAFNGARYNAFVEHFGSWDGLRQVMPTASAVGIEGGGFFLSCLAAETPGLPVENPRQTPAYRYSKRHGPVPPCFSRATLLERKSAPPCLLVAGTASITGEDSRHEGNLDDQFSETIRNLAHLISVAAGHAQGVSDAPEHRPVLAALEEVRVYYPKASHRPRLEALTAITFHPDTRVEFVRATVCRPELLVEIEAFALPELVASR